MKIPKLRQEFRRPCILRHLHNSKNHKFIIWEKERRITSEFLLQQVSPMFRTAKFVSFELNKGIDWRISTDKILYFYCSKSSLVFKGKVTYLSGSELGIDFPEAIQCAEQRKNTRTVFQLPFKIMDSEERKISFQLEHSEKKKLYTKSLVDLGEMGASFLITNEEIKLFYPKDSINITGISGNIFETNKAKVVYVDKFLMEDSILQVSIE